MIPLALHARFRATPSVLSQSPRRLLANPLSALFLAAWVAPYGGHAAKLRLSASLEGQGAAGGLATHSEIRFISPCECRRLVAGDHTH